MAEGIRWMAQGAAGGMRKMALTSVDALIPGQPHFSSFFFLPKPKALPSCREQGEGPAVPRGLGSRVWATGVPAAG